jgi:hypothetical protein
MIRSSDTFVIPFSLLWCGFAIFWEASVLMTDSPWFFKVWGVPFVLVGLYFVFGRFIVDARLRQHTVYGVTSARVIIISGLLHESVQSLHLRGLADISLSEKPDGSGNVVLGRTSILGALVIPGWPGSRQYTPPTFEGISQARTVYDLIRRAQSGAV